MIGQSRFAHTASTSMLFHRNLRLQALASRPFVLYKNNVIQLSSSSHKHEDHSHHSEQEQNKTGMEWATKALVALAATCTVVYAWHRWNEYYRSRGLVHPITAFITRHMTIEVEDRERRIASLEYHNSQAQKRLQEDPNRWRQTINERL